MEKKTFYRVANTETNQGLWYDMKGRFTGLIHREFDFCESSKLPMPFDEDVVGYLSCTDNLENLWMWFSKEDIEKLEPHGFFVHEYESDDYRYYENHWIFNQETVTLIQIFEINSLV